MKDELRHDIVQRWQQGQSQRHIASELDVSRRTVGRVLATARDSPNHSTLAARHYQIADAFVPQTRIMNHVSLTTHH